MFDSILQPAAIPRRRIGTGAAFAVAIHAWLLVGALAHTRPSEASDKPPPRTLDLVLASSPAPPPLGGGGSPAKTASHAPKWTPSSPLRPPVADARPRSDKPDPPPAADPPAGPEGGDSEGGDGQGDGPGVGPGTDHGDPNGVPGGTGTAKSGPPPTFLLLNIGDPALDQTTCELGGYPPYPKDALAARVEGTVLVRCTVEPSGSLSSCTILKAPYSFEPPVKAWLATAHARPFTAAGKPVRVPCNFKFNYKIDP